MLTSGRRRSERFAPGEPWDGSVSVMRDVIVQLESDGRLVAFAEAAGVVGEVMRLDLSGGGDALALDVEVLDSRPVIVECGVRHRVRLEVVADGR
jgi:hypothetical protein